MSQAPPESYRSFVVAEVETKGSLESLSGSKLANSLYLLRGDVIGSYNKFTTPFGKKAIIYADWTASGRPVDKIEKYLLNEVMPFYGNTHTTTSVTGHQSTCFRNEARQIVAESVNAKVTGKAAEDVVIFTGNGTTAAVHKLVDGLGLNTPFPIGQDQSKRPVVFVSSYEHHSNLLPWRESVADVVTIAYNSVTGVCLTDLQHQLSLHADRVMKIGAFSAASNVTGICTAVDEVCILLHQHNALAVFDYATAAPYVKIDMNPVLHNNPLFALAYKDAIYFSGHKFLGGPGCPGVLVTKSRIMPQSFETPSSASVGGGTVFYVTEHHHRYLSNREEREEGGTPHILGDVKLGLVMSLKKSIRAAWIESEEFRISSYVQSKLQAHPAVVLLGKPAAAEATDAAKYLPIFSFLLRCGEKFLHFNFVAALLNDLFGIQCRGGCMCAGPFSQSLLGITDALNQAFEQALLNRHEVLRPGYTRLSFPFWISQSEIDYIVDAILFVADHGWKFLPSYRYNHMTGGWAHTTRLTRFPERKWLSNFSINSYNGSAEPAPVKEEIEGGAAPARKALEAWGVSSTDEVLALIRADVQAELKKIDAVLLKAQQKQAGQVRAPAAATAAVAGDGEGLQSFEGLRWFVSAEEAAAAQATNGAGISTLKGPIQPQHLGSTAVSQPGGQAAGEKAGLAVSAFTFKRDQKFKAHTGSEEVLPRYLTLKTVSKGVVSGANQVPVKPSASTAKPSDASVDMVAPLAAVGAVQAEASAVVTDEFTCATGTCSFRQRENVVEAVELPGVVTGNGKVLSGPGRTYLPSAPQNPGAIAPSGKAKSLFHTPNKKIMKAVGQAVKDWSMIEEGDRLLLGLSGGKDSLALLHILIALQKRAPVKFEIACATVDPQTDSFDPSPLIPYVQSLGITYHYLSEPIVELAKSKLQGDSLCAFCSRFKRGLLYSCCRNFKYNKLVLAQHLDDLVESFMMSTMHNGQVRTMKANYSIEAGDVRVIRPLIYVRELMTRDFSQASQLPIINENCPACFEQPKERARLKKLMAQEETMVPNLFQNMKRALVPLMADDTYDAMDAVARRIETANFNPKNRLAAEKRSAALAVAGGDANGGDIEAAASGETSKRTKRDIREPVGVDTGNSAVAGEDGRMDEAEDEIEETGNDNQACGANGGYCPPCYELA